jgi:hypothetical protein
VFVVEVGALAAEEIRRVMDGCGAE